MSLRSRTTLPVLSRMAVAVLVSLCACTGGGETEPVPPAAADDEGGTAWFTDRAQAAGLDFVHVNGMTGNFYQPEIMGSGAALFDYDNDGDLDVYLVQGGTLGAPTPIAPPGGRPLTDRLYRNDLEVGPDGDRTLRFTDVTEASRITARGYGQGVAAGDFDNDGWVDLYLTRFGPNQLFRNQGDGTFADVSERTGTADPGWGVPAAFVDVDRDGWLDLFVGNYLHYALKTHIDCVSPLSGTGYCTPGLYRPAPNRFYHNLGNGRFADMTAAAGLAGDFGPALGVATADVDNDGWIDIFVANDGTPNQLWINQRDGTFLNEALLSGVALGAAGEAKADMGVDAGDFDHDGDEDLLITEITGQGSTLYVNDGTGLFEEQSARAGIRLPSLPYTGFGTAWLDFDNDGWLDVLSVNGLVKHYVDAMGPDDPFPLQQRNQLLHNLGDGRFEDVTDRAGAVFDLAEVSRGAAFGDIDNDGDVDVLVTNAAGPVRLLMNGVGAQSHWLGLRLVAEEAGGRDMVGARVAVMRADGMTVWRRARSDGSYASANDPRVLVGLGASAEPPRVRVIWPSGRVEEWRAVPVDRYTTLVEGGGS